MKKFTKKCKRIYLILIFMILFAIFRGFYYFFRVLFLYSDIRNMNECYPPKAVPAVQNVTGLLRSGEKDVILEKKWDAAARKNGL